MFTDLIGVRLDGRPIYLLRGGDPEAPAPGTPPAPGAPPAPVPVPAPVQTAPPAALPAPAVPAAPTWTPPSQDEWQATQAAVQEMQQRMAQLATLNVPPAVDDSADDDPPPSTPPVNQDRSKAPSWADFDRMQAALSKANKQAAAQRKAAEEQQRQWAEQDAARKLAAEQQAALLAATQLAREEAERLYKPATIKAAAVPALAAAGARTDRLDMIMGLVNQAALTVEGSEVQGLTEQIEAVKAMVPEWFAPADPTATAPPARPAVPRVTTGDQPPAAPTQPQRSADILAQAILGQS